MVSGKECFTVVVTNPCRKKGMETREKDRKRGRNTDTQTDRERQRKGGI